MPHLLVFVNGLPSNKKNLMAATFLSVNQRYQKNFYAIEIKNRCSEIFVFCVLKTAHCDKNYPFVRLLSKKKERKKERKLFGLSRTN
jgi:hypothetical protein